MFGCLGLDRHASLAMTMVWGLALALALTMVRGLALTEMASLRAKRGSPFLDRHGPPDLAMTQTMSTSSAKTA